MQRDGQSKSLWQNTEAVTFNDQPGEDELFDVLIAGAGITGLSTALLLQEQGKKCVVVEAHTIGFGTTLGTTAHLNNFFDTPYQQVARDFSAGKAKQLYQAAEAALLQIKKNISNYKIACGYSETTAFLFSVEEEQNKVLDDIVSGGKEAGLPVAYTNDTVFPVPYLKIATVSGQAQFNPALYIQGLAKAFQKLGGKILEGCRVLSHSGDDILTVTTSISVIKAANLVYATHIPPGVNLLHFRCAPYRSYAMAVTLSDGNYPAGLGYDLHDPYHYYRTQEVDGVNYLVAGGEDHKTAHVENTEECFRKLESHIRQFFTVERIAFRWSSQYYEPADGLPYIGRLPGHRANVFVATGFGGNGMIYGTISSLVFAELLGMPNGDLHTLFDPGRLKPVAGFTNFMKEGADVVKNLITGKLSAEKISAVAELAAGEAKIVRYDGNMIALYKDQQHNLYALDPACPHVKCTVAWNQAEQSWDCPCHGSRFDKEGIVLTGPAQDDLKKLHIDT